MHNKLICVVTFASNTLQMELNRHEVSVAPSYLKNKIYCDNLIRWPDTI